MFRLALLAVTVTLGLFSHSLCAENWPHWRGPTQDGHCTEKNLPVEWNREKNVAWMLALPGAAGATPVVWDDRIFLTSSQGKGQTGQDVEQGLFLIAVSRDGKELWRQTVSEGNKDVRGDEGNSASPSPVTDGKHVWAFFANGVLGCYTVDGKEVWKLDLQDRYGKLQIAFGMTASLSLIHI